MKKILILVFGLLIVGSITAHTKLDFEQRMSDHVVQYLADRGNLTAIKGWAAHSCDKNHIVTHEETVNMAVEKAKGQFVHQNMKEYIKL